MTRSTGHVRLCTVLCMAFIYNTFGKGETMAPSDIDYVDTLNVNFNSYVYFDFANSTNKIELSTITTISQANLATRWNTNSPEDVSFYRSGGAFNGGSFVAPSTPIGVILPPGTMQDTGLIVSFWVFASETTTGTGGTGFGCFNQNVEPHGDICLSDEETFNRIGSPSTFRITEWKNNHYVFLFGSPGAGSPGSLPLNEWTHVLIHLTKRDQNIYFNGVPIIKAYTIARMPYETLSTTLPIWFDLPSTSNRATLKFSHYAIVFGEYSKEQALTLYDCLASQRTPISLPTAPPFSEPASTPSALLKTMRPSLQPTAVPTTSPSFFPTISPTLQPSPQPTTRPSPRPSTMALNSPSPVVKTDSPLPTNSKGHTDQATAEPTVEPTAEPTEEPTESPTILPPTPTIISVKPVEIDVYDIVILSLVFVNGLCCGMIVMCCYNYLISSCRSTRPRSPEYQMVSTAEV